MNSRTRRASIRRRRTTLRSRAGNTLYISGQLTMDPSGAVVGLGDARAQARQCYENLGAILAHYGGSLRHLLKTTTYVTH